MKVLNTILLLIGSTYAASVQEMLNTNLGSNASASYNDSTVTASLALDKYTITLACLFMIQLFFCVIILSSTNKKVKEIEARNEKQKADFYSFLYQFHKQMHDENGEIAQYAKKCAMDTNMMAMSTPGGPKMD